MLTRWKVFNKSSSDEEENEGVIPQTAPAAGASERERGDDWERGDDCLRDLLVAVAALAVILQADVDNGGRCVCGPLHLLLPTCGTLQGHLASLLAEMRALELPLEGCFGLLFRVGS
ncbi:unnamed protein product [Lampetra planeri]